MTCATPSTRARSRTRRRAGSRRDRAGRPDGVQRVRHRLRRAVGGAPPGAERRRRRRRMAGAISLGFVDFDNQALARQSALDVAGAEQGVGRSAGRHARRRHVPGVPAGFAGRRHNACIRVDVFRNQRAGGNPLPTFFGQLVGVIDQGVRATATAEALFGDSTDCVKPFAIPDKWLEQRNDQRARRLERRRHFERYDRTAQPRRAADAGRLLRVAGAPAATTGRTAPGSRASPSALAAATTAARSSLKAGNPHQAIAPGWYHPVVHQSAEGRAATTIATTSRRCDPTVIGPGTVLTVEPGNMIGPTSQGMEDSDRAGSGRRAGTRCSMAARAASPAAAWRRATCAISPRLVAIPVFNPDAYDVGPGAAAASTSRSSRCSGSSSSGCSGNDVIGYLMTYPSAPRGRHGQHARCGILSSASRW